MKTKDLVKLLSEKGLTPEQVFRIIKSSELLRAMKSRRKELRNIRRRSTTRYLSPFPGKSGQNLRRAEHL